MTPKDVLKLAKERNIEFLDLKFCDLPGMWQHRGMPVSQLTEELFEEGLGFDGSRVRGWQPVNNNSDLVLRPNPGTARIEPFTTRPTLSFICNVFDPVTGQAYSRDPRQVLAKAQAYLEATGIADTANFGPEAEFFVFDDVRSEQTQASAFYAVDSTEGPWNSGRDERPNLGYKAHHKEGHFPCAPTDTLWGLRQEMVAQLQQLGIVIEAEHHEAATGGQCEIDMRFDSALACADNLMWLKYVVKNVARQSGRAATFMPKPLFDDNGSGMHTHMSLWKDSKPLFAGDGYGGLSDIALWYVGGILKHAPALLALTNPTTNSYRRLVPGCEAPIKLAYSSRTRSAAVRIPMVSTNPNTKRIEFRTPDPTCNGYLAFAAMLMAGLDGIENKVDPGEALDKDVQALDHDERSQLRSVPVSLAEALQALADDHAFLLRGDVFTEDIVAAWLEYKHEHEVQPMRLRPTPYEFLLYFDA